MRADTFEKWVEFLDRLDEWREIQSFTRWLVTYRPDIVADLPDIPSLLDDAVAEYMGQDPDEYRRTREKLREQMGLPPLN
mgnify:CR=1 FL=1